MWVRHRLESIIALVATALGGVYLALPRMGSDLAAQVARAGFFAAHGWTPVDLRWYAGVDQLGYSLLSQPVMAVLGVRVAGVVSVVAGSVLLAVLLRRTGGRRLWLAGGLGLAGLAGNLVSGRVTYGLGVCLGLAALVALTFLPRRSAALAALLLAALAAATSPVVALFLGLTGTALLAAPHVRFPRPHTPEPQPHRPPEASPEPRHIPGGRPRAGGRPPEVPSRRGDTPGRRPRAGGWSAGVRGLLVAGPAAVLIGLNALLFGDGGWMNISRTDTVHAVVTGLVVAALVPVRPIRMGALLSSAGVLGAALIHTPVGLNATRLAVMFALPVLAAYGRIPALRKKWLIVLPLALLAWWQPPIVSADLRDLGNPTADPDYFRPLTEVLATRELTGRVEIPPTRDYWEAARMGDVPLARGWLRQADIDRNPLFFTTVPGASGTRVALTAETYRAWLAEQAVQFVAVPDAELSWPGRAEARLVTDGLPYLTLIWTGPHWRLYAVAGPRPIVAAPAALVRHTAAAITLDAPAAGDVRLRVRWHRWLRASGGAEVLRDGDWTILRVPGPGRYTLSS
ncbi:hypothetical protein [Actinoplanes siamensis]|uniref:MFS transporter n=1 Tax=Actinoplanes siamensis TaxID=1223317 RepID=A0A919N4V9_9ACTN|nr:hypothetical protein [Actinoplanes siamensis]GIF04459.1 MFS transporter [Actinoplanes siamensis]